MTIQIHLDIHAALPGERDLVVGLDRHPVVRRNAPRRLEAHRSVGRDAALAEDDLVDAPRRDAEAHGQRGLADVERQQVLVDEVPGMDELAPDDGLDDELGGHETHNALGCARWTRTLATAITGRVIPRFGPARIVRLGRFAAGGAVAARYFIRRRPAS